MSIVRYPKKKVNLILFVVFLLLFISLLTPIQHINAQDTESSILLSAPVSYVKPGDTVPIFFQNNTNEPISFTIRPVLFELMSGTNSIEIASNIPPIDESYISFENSVSTLDPGQSVNFDVIYKRTQNPYFVGLLFEQVADLNAPVSVSFQMASIFVDMTLSNSDFTQIQTEFSVTPEKTIFGISIAPTYTLKSKIANNSDRVLRIQGEIIIKSDETYLYTVPQSQELLDSLLPQDQKEFESVFEDSRSLFSRFGNIEFEQTFVINGEPVVLRFKYFSFPLELMGLATASIVVFTLLILFLGRRRGKRRRW